MGYMEEYIRQYQKLVERNTDRVISYREAEKEFLDLVEFVRLIINGEVRGYLYV